jgi:C4-dicarboxylate-specific signal transduction histidine kinase
MLKRGASSQGPLSVNRLVGDVLAFMRGELVRCGVAVDLALDPGIAEIRGDAIPLEQVLINIIGNACDAMEANAPGDRAIRIATSSDPGCVHVRISDLGHGLPVTPDRVFEPFYTTKANGLGMGLAISRSIVAAHGGKLWAEASGTRGTTFQVTLPTTVQE